MIRTIHLDAFTRSPQGLWRKPARPSTEGQLEPAAVAAAASGLAWLKSSIDQYALQSCVSSHPDFQPTATTTPEMIRRGEFPSDVKHRFDALGGGQPENFTTYMALKYLSDAFGAQQRTLVEFAATKRLKDAPRYYFFQDPRAIMVDIDDSGVALVGLYRSRHLDAAQLREGARHILMSAASESVSREQNNAGDKGENGALYAGVLKAYWDDHPESVALRRGRKHDPVVAINGLHAVLLAERDAALNLDETIEVLEYRPDDTPVRARFCGRTIVERTMRYISAHLTSFEYLDGTRYYPAPEVFLAFLAELVVEFPRWFGHLRDAVIMALEHRKRWPACPGTAENPQSAINQAMRIMAQRQLGMRIQPEQLLSLLQQQQQSGAWPAGPLFSLGSIRHFFGGEALSTIFAVKALQG